MLTRVLPPVAIWGYRTVGNSWRYTAPNAHILTELNRTGQPVVGAFLHQRTIQLLHYFSSPERGRWILMCSQSRDGELMTKIEEGLGFRVARGSSGKGGARALVEMIKAQREDRGLHSCLAIDGSRGPRGVAQLGVITLAQKTGSLVLPVAASTNDCWVWQKSWDRAVVPKWGANIHVDLGEPFAVPPKLDAEALEALRLKMETGLIAQHRALDARTGFRDSQPMQSTSPDP
jgi:lysophospholipid acyltransferase (LPLAT)-like uncharacterized protein